MYLCLASCYHLDAEPESSNCLGGVSLLADSVLNDGDYLLLRIIFVT